MFSTVIPQYRKTITKRKEKEKIHIGSCHSWNYRLINYNYLINSMFQAYHIAWLSCNHSPEALNILIPQHWISWTVLCADCLITPLRVTPIRIVQKFDPKLHSPCSSYAGIVVLFVQHHQYSHQTSRLITTMVCNHKAQLHASTNGTWLCLGHQPFV